MRKSEINVKNILFIHKPASVTDTDEFLKSVFDFAPYKSYRENNRNLSLIFDPEKFEDAFLNNDYEESFIYLI